MTVLFASTFGLAGGWLPHLEAALPDDTIEVWPDVSDRAAVEFVVCWDLDARELASFPNLRGVLVTGAGVSHLRPLEAVAPDVPIVRLADPQVARDMADFAVMWAMWFQRGMHRYADQQRRRVYERRGYPAAGDMTVGVLGWGSIGAAVGERAAAAGFAVAGWKRSPLVVEQVDMFVGDDGLHEFLQVTDVLVNVLPLTADTRRILDDTAFDRLTLDRAGRFIINIGRAGTIDDQALCRALDDGRLGGAVLDVHRTEPLPAESPLWDQPGLVLTPHVSGFTYPESATRLIAANIGRIRAGKQPFPVVDRSRGY